MIDMKKVSCDIIRNFHYGSEAMARHRRQAIALHEHAFLPYDIEIEMSGEFLRSVLFADWLHGFRINV